MIAGLEVHDLTLHEDNRGWFKENWAGQALVPRQQNVSFNARRGATRGMHAEPWDKWVSVASGRVFGAWVDMRSGSTTFGETFTCEIGPDTAVFVPRGVANGFQALEDDTTYIYLVNQLYSPGGAFCSYKEIDWPLEPTELSAADQAHPMLADATPLPPRRILVTGANGQLGRALKRLLADADFCTHADFDITDPPERNWKQYSAIINCAAYNDVNGAENDRAAAWAVNAEGALTPKGVAEVENFVKSRKIPAVFCESTVSNAPMMQVVKATGAEYGGTLYVDSLSEENGPVPTYLDLIRHDTKVIIDGLNGGKQ